MRRFIILFFLFLNWKANSQANTDSLLSELTHIMKQSPAYDAAKLKGIGQLKQSLVKAGDPANIFAINEQIYEEYRIFNYDSAYQYGIRLINLARTLNDESHLVAARLKLSFILLSAGLYKETYDSLASFKPGQVPESLKGEYYALWGRYYYDVAGYASDNYHSVDYDIIGGRYMDSALAYYPAGSFEYEYYSGLRLFKQNHVQAASSYFEKLMRDTSLSYHQLALTASTLSGIYLQKGDADMALNLLIQATTADIRSSTKETGAIFHLAELLYKRGDLKHAALCIETGIANAEFYGARQRKLQASSILPLIEGERINGIEAQKNLLVKYAIILSSLVLLLIFLTYVILKQVKKLKLAQQALTEANALQQVINDELASTNKRLEEVNEKLEEANKIKEEYLGYFFDMDSAFYGKLDKIKQTIDQKLTERRYEDIRFFLNKIDAKKEKHDLLTSFDKIFLKLFPHFVDEVNALLHEEERIRLKENELLNTDLRIFALMRMGISDTEKIAQILEYSVKTIYSYKTKIKNKSFVPNEEFEDRIMKIKSL